MVLTIEISLVRNNIKSSLKSSLKHNILIVIPLNLVENKYNFKTLKKLFLFSSIIQSAINDKPALGQEEAIVPPEILKISFSNF